MPGVFGTTPTARTGLPPAPKPSPAKPPPPVPTSLQTGNNPRGVAIAPPPRPTINDRQAIAQASPQRNRSDAASGGYDVARANAYKTTPAYTQAVVSVFKAQPATQQQVIIKAAQRTSTPEGNAVLSYTKGLGRGGGLAPAAITGISPGMVGPAIAGGPGAVGKFLAPAVNFLGKVGADAYNLPGGTVEGLYGVGKDIVTGHEGAALHAFVDPYIQLAEHPIRTFMQHPLNTALLATGPKDVLARGAGAVARTGALGDAAKAAASTVRAPLHVGTIAGEPSPILEARNFSPDVVNKAFQAAREQVIRRRGQNPDISRPAPGLLPHNVAYAMNAGTRAKLYRQTDEMTAVHQMQQRGERNQAIQNIQRAQPSKPAQNVVAHALQGVIRTPETAVADATKEINRLQAVQATLPRRSLDLQWNRQQVRDLSTALKTPGALNEAIRAASAIRPRIHAQDAYLVQHGLLDPAQAMRSKLMPYAIAHMGAKPFHGIKAQFEGDTALGPRLEHADGSALSTQAILDHLKANGVPDPAYVGHLPGKVGPGRFYSAYKLARGSLGQRTRTGEAFRKGAYDHTWNGLIGQAASRAQAVAKASLHDRVISRFGVKIPQPLLDKMGIRSPNGDFTPAEAKAIARAALVDDHGNPIPNALELTPISRAPMHVLDQVRNLQHPQELQNISQLELQALAHAVRDTAQRTDGTRNVALVPSDVTQRFAEQYARTDGLLRSVGRVTQQFRRTVLPYSTHWMLQIGSEAGLRAILGGVLHPDYLAAGRKLTDYLEKTPAGRARNAEMTNATFYSGGGAGVRDAALGRAGRGNLDIHNPNAGKVASAARAFPPTRALIAAHNRYADTVTAAMYGLEHNARLMGLGKLAHKDVQSFGFSWRNAVHLQGHAIADLGERLKADPALTAKFGREIDNIFGKYSKFTPKQRAMIQSFTPFLPWYLNAAKYVLWHLPAHHPVASSLLASLRQTVNQDIQDGKQAPLNAWAMQELARISPFGIFTPPSTKPSTGGVLAGQQITGAILPQAESAFYNLAGVNAFGSGPLKQPPSGTNYKGDVKPKSGPALAAATENLLEAFLPLARYVKLAEQGGKPSYGTGTVLSPQVKPGGGNPNAGSVLKRIFNPFYSVQAAQGAANAPKYGAPPAAPSGNSGWNFGGSSAPSSSSSGWDFSGSGSTGTSSSGWSFK